MTESILDETFVHHGSEMALSRLTTSQEHFHPADKTILVIDGSNLYGACRSLNAQLDYKRFFNMFRDITNLAAIYFLVGVSDDPHHRHLADLVLWMKRNGVRVRTKTSKKDLDTQLWKGNMDVEIAVVTLVECATADHIVLASGDGDFVSVVKACQARGQKVTVVSTKRPTDTQLSPELHNCVDGFIELGDYFASMATHPEH